MTNLQFFKACFDNEFKATEALIAALPDNQLSYRPHPVNRSAYEIAEHIIAHVADLGIMLHQGSCDEILSYPFDNAVDGAKSSVRYGPKLQQSWPIIPKSVG